MARIEINNDIGGIELYFDTVPTEEDKEALKKNGFRWHAEKKCWYAKNTDNNREVASSIFDRIDKFNEETRNIIKVNDVGFDYAVIVMQAGKQCEVILREIIENEGIPVDERGFIDTSNDKRFPRHKNMPLLTYACMSPNLLPPEIRRVMDYIRKGRNMAAHIPAMTREQAEQFMQAFNAFSSWYYFHSGAYKSFNTMGALYELDSFSAEETANRADLIATSFKNHYADSVSTTDLLNAIYADLEAEDISRQYIDTCVTGFLGVLAGTTTMFGIGLSISLCYYNVYMNLYDQVRLTALHYSLSGRVAGRLDELLWG